MDDRFARLLAFMRGLGHVVTAYSGGVDSTLTAFAAAQALGPRALAVTAVSPLMARADVETALDKALALGLRHEVLPFPALAVEGLAANGPNRCYHCKRAALGLLARRLGPAGVLAEGTNADDDPARPGRRAVRELGAVSPLAACGLAKDDVRGISRELGLPGWDAPSNSCLATRLATGARLTLEGLRRVEALEDELRGCGLADLRCRDQGEGLCVETRPEDAAHLARCREQLEHRARQAGFRHILFKDRA